MDCRETQTLLTAFHDGELPAAERARVEGHLRGCPECAVLLADLARVDRAAGVPDPGPAYWDRFNARVMDRVEREADGPGVAVLRPKGGWMRQQLRYLVPAVAAAALVVVIVHYGGMHPGAPAPTVPPAVSEPAPPVPADQRMAKAETGSRAAKMAENTAAARRVTEESTRVVEAPRDRAAAPAAMSAPSPVPPTTFRGVPSGSPPLLAEDGIPSGMQAERKKMAGAASQMAEQEVAGKAKAASRMRVAKDPSAEAPPAASLTSAPSRAASPCELARTLADRERFREAETAQRACLAEDLPDPAREKGLVFLAELLDRQSRFAEADTVITEVARKFPQSRPLDLYRQQRPMIQKRPE